MKILFINSLGYEAGGTETSIKKLKEGLLLKGHEVKIVTSDFTNGQKLFSDYTFKYHDGLIQRILFRLFNPDSYKLVKTVLDEYKPDIVHLHRMDFVSPSVLFLLKNYTTVMTIHGPEDFIKSLLIWFMPHSFFKNNTVSKKSLNFKGKLHYFYHLYVQVLIYRFALKNVKLFIVPSNYFSQIIDKNIKPIVTIHNGVELLKYSKKSQCTYRLLYVGRLDKTKGTDYLIKALPQILNKFPQTTLSIIGEGVFQKELVALTKNLNLDKKIFFIPWQKSENIEKYYQQSDIVIMPSIWPEAFGKVGLEAMSVGRPIIGSRVGGIPEWLEHGKSGYLIKPENSEEISKKVLELFSNKKLLGDMGINARKKSEEFRLENHIDNIENLYKKLLNREELFK